MNTFRSFIGLSVPESIQSLIYHQIKPFQVATDCKWTEKNNLHINLKFLGKITAREADIISKYLDQQVVSLNKFKLKSREVVFFPNAKRPRIYAINFEFNQILQDIQLNLNKFLATRKIASVEKRDFTPHITLARFKNQPVARIIKELSEINYDLEFEVKQIHLYQSVLNPQGPFYEVLHTSKF